jgi:hypothetical protein
MRLVLVGYGQFENYQVCELPQDELQRLGERFPLTFAKCQDLECNEILITVAIHEELARRARGAKPETRRPSERELAREIISKGFIYLSKTHHPDKASGDGTLQKRLASVREQLTSLVSQIQEENDPEDAVVIAEPPSRRARKNDLRGEEDPFCGMGFTDEDVPF